MDISQNLPKTELIDRILWIDGDSSYAPEKLPSILLSKGANNVYCTSMSKDVEQFNKIANNKITVKKSLKHISTDWNIPEKYYSINLFQYIYNKFIDICVKENFSKKQAAARLTRIKSEYDLFEKSNLIDMIRTCVYIVDEFKSNNIVWGTGRGSSCTSYILYILELHNVDSFLYDLDINEFIR